MQLPAYVKEWMTLGGIGIAISVVIGYYGIYVPKHNEVRLIRAQSAQQQLHQQAQADVAKLLEQINQYHRRLPDDPDPSRLVKEVMEVAEKDGVQLTSIAQDPPQALDSYTRLVVNLQFNASYHQLAAFLDDIERSTLFIHVERFEFTTADAQGVAPIQLTLSTFFLPPLVPGASPPAPSS